MRGQSSHAGRAAITAVVGSVCFLAAICAGGTGVAADEPMFVSKPISPANEYTTGIEGPAVSAAGELYVMNVARPSDDPNKKGGIGRLKPGASKSELFAILPDDSVGNGSRFDSQGRMYVADYVNHKIFVFEPGDATPREYFRGQFHQPNDLAIGRDGTLYASDPKASDGIGQIWQITRGPDGLGRGAIMAPPQTMGITNGIDLSPDNATLYVSESQFSHSGARRRASIWAYRIDGAALADPRLVIEFPQGDVDGLRVDTDGRILVARPSFGTVSIVTPQGHLVRDVKTAGTDPTNLTFGGADGRDVFVTQAQKAKRFIERFRTDRPDANPACSRLFRPARRSRRERKGDRRRRYRGYGCAGFFTPAGGGFIAAACAGRYLATMAGSSWAIAVSGKRNQVSSLPNSEIPR
jgi:sugar lactone lactonase YvrE